MPEVRWETEEDSDVCDACEDMDGEVWDDRDDADDPPLHPNCRCTLVWNEDSDEGTEGDPVPD